MKIASKVVMIVVALGLLGAAAWGGLRLYRRYAPPGRAGRNMEVRLVALYGPASQPGAAPAADASQTNAAPAPAGAVPGIDVFQRQDVSSSISTGNAPSGWKWLPIAGNVQKEVSANSPSGSPNDYVTRTSNGQMFLLAADTPDTALTHADNVKPWGVDSVQIVTDDMGPAVEIHLDQAGGDLMHDFTEKYQGHRIAVVVAGQICEVALIQYPVRSGLVVRLPPGQQADAENLRDVLMK